MPSPAPSPTVTIILAIISGGGFTVLLGIVMYLIRDRHQDDVKEQAQEIANDVALKQADTAFSQMVVSRLNKVEDDLRAAYEKIEVNNKQIASANSQIAELRGDKAGLEHLVENLREQVSALRAELEHYKKNEAMYQAQISDLQERLAAKTAELAAFELQLAQRANTGSHS